MMVNEIWKPVVNEKMRNGQYEVSSLGRLRNKNTGHILKPFISNTGYCRISINDFRTSKKKNTNLSVHRLVAEAFIPNECNKPEVNHKDGNKMNNSVDNLEWSTESENRHHAYTTHLDPQGEERINAKLSNSIVHRISKLLSEGYRPTDIARTVEHEFLYLNYDAVKKIICDIQRGRSWQFIYTQYPKFKGDRKELLRQRIRLLYKSGYTDKDVIKHILVTDFEYASVTKNYIKDVIKKMKECEGSTTIESEIDGIYIHI